MKKDRRDIIIDASTKHSGENHDTKRNYKRSKVWKVKRNSSSMFAGTWVCAIVLLAFCALLISNLFKLQIIEHELHAQEAADFHYRKIVEYPIRGAIFDSNGRELAFSSTVETIGVTPADVKSLADKTITKEEIAAKIAEVLVLDYQDVLTKISDIDKTWVLLKKRVEKQQADVLKAYRKEFEIGGISFDREVKRVYPEGSLAGTILGFSNIDGDGQLGLELQYNDELTGTPGYTYAETDNYGKAALPFAVPVSFKARNGNNLITTIDVEIQKIVENELRESVRNYNVADGGIAIVMDPYTGGILAMANTPGFDPNNPTQCPEGLNPDNWDPSSTEAAEFLSEYVWKNRAISDTYEPGSTFKAITAAIAMEEGKFTENEILSDAPIKVADRLIGCSYKGGHGLESTMKAFWNSCNPIFVQLSQRVGIPAYYEYVRAFGFYENTGIDLPGEGQGIFHTNPAEIDMACLSFGEQSAVTPLSMITSYAAFANGGSLIRPRIVKALTDSDGNVIKEFAPEVVRQVVSEETAIRVRNLLEGVVAYGTGSKGYIEGYHVGGKTSTSTRDDLSNVISFLSMAPISQPRICIIVILFAPDKENARSSLAALTSAKMTEQILEYLGQPRDFSNDDIAKISLQYTVPDITGKTYEEAARSLFALNLNIEDPSGNISKDGIVKSQWPKEGTILHKSGTVSVYAVVNPEIPTAVVPDVTGKNINECISAMTESGINIIIDGKCLGEAVSQQFTPGTVVKLRDTMKVVFAQTEEEDNQ